MGERDAARVDVVVDDLRQLRACLYSAGEPILDQGAGSPSSAVLTYPAPAEGPVILERALRAADGIALREALVAAAPPALQHLAAELAAEGHALWSLRSRPNPQASALARLRWLAPQPWHWELEQPPFNRTWATRADPGQFNPRAPMEVLGDAIVDLVLVDAGPDRVGVIRALRAHDPTLTLRDARARTIEVPSELAASIAAGEGAALAERLHALGAIVESRPIERAYTAPSPAWNPRGFDRAALEGGSPGLVVLEVVGDALHLLEFRITWPHPHEPEAAHRLVEARPLVEILGGDMSALASLRASIDRIIDERRARFIVCRFCGAETPPEWAHGGDTCDACAERHLGVVH